MKETFTLRSGSEHLTLAKYVLVLDNLCLDSARRTAWVFKELRKSNKAVATFPGVSSIIVNVLPDIAKQLVQAQCSWEGFLGLGLEEDNLNNLKGLDGQDQPIGWPTLTMEKKLEELNW
jgi:hypothetical protein